MGKTHLSIAKARLAANERHYAQETEKLCAEIRRQLVKPFCDQRGWMFSAGMGVWAIGPFGKTVFPDDAENKDDKELQELAEVLDLEIPGWNNSVGSYMRDYTPRKVANN